MNDSSTREINGSVWTTTELKRAYSDWQIRSALQRGQLHTLRRGWYAMDGSDPAVVRAVTAGGVLSCVSALQRRGVWTARTSTVHVRRGPRQASPLPAGLTSCGSRTHRRWPQHHACDDVVASLLVAASCCSREEWVAAVESSIHVGLATEAELIAASDLLPRGCRPWLALVDRSESGTESLVRQRLRSRRIPCQPQVRIAGVGRVDLLVGRWLILEIDSRAHHTGEQHYASDRHRDQRALLLGYHTVRLTWEQVILTWDETWLTLHALLKARVHLRRAHGHPLAA